MKISSKWQYDEMRPCGVDYTQPEQVAVYDSMHKKFRDYIKSAEDIIRHLALNSNSIVIDLGSGTGAFSLHASTKCRMVYAVDISAAMLEYCRQQAAKDYLTNIVFCQSSLLTYEHAGELADAVVCVAVLHHLPDFWKLIALKRCYAMLKPGGRFFLFDIVFPSGEVNLQQRIEEWIKAIGTMSDGRLEQESVIHVRDEFSTYDWIMEGIIMRSGFRIDETEYGKGFQATYVCTKK